VDNLTGSFTAELCLEKSTVTLLKPIVNISAADLVVSKSRRQIGVRFEISTGPYDLCLSVRQLGHHLHVQEEYFIQTRSFYDFPFWTFGLEREDQQAENRQTDIQHHCVIYLSLE